MRKKMVKCIKCGKNINLNYTGNHEVYTWDSKNNEYTCERCM